MKLSMHASRTEKIVGIRAEDIHKWIDGLFDSERLDSFLRFGSKNGYSPYDHRKFRHCQESLVEAYEEFEAKYTREQIKAVFECHIKDDYDGYLPHREDFENGTFKEKYHDIDEHIEHDKILSKKELSEYFEHNVKPAKYSKSLTKGFLTRIVAPTILAMVLFVSTIFAVVIPIFRDNMMERKKEMIRELTTSAISVIDYYIKLEQAGTMTRADAQNHAITQIKEMRYGDEGKDYFWITDKYPKMVMHPYRHDLTGADLSTYTDSENKSGKRLFVEFVRMVNESGDGYLEYLWQWKDDASRTAPKLSYVKGIDDWGWIIGTGVYINDVEEEIKKLSHKLLLVFAFISLGLVILLVNVVLQSHRIEINKQKAETGLREAKDRYRALVEASKEGYMLEVEGEIVYSNITVQRMLGYDEDEIRAIKILDLLTKNSTVNDEAIENITHLSEGKTRSMLFEAQVSTKSGKKLEVMISTSRMFFSKKNGHIISIRPIIHKELSSALSTFGADTQYFTDIFSARQASEIARPLEPSQNIDADSVLIAEDTPVFTAFAELTRSEVETLYTKDRNGNITGMLGLIDIAGMYAGLPAELLSEIDKSQSVGHVINTLNRLPLLIRNMTNQGANAKVLRTTMGTMYDAAIIKFIEFSIQTLGTPPAKFAFLSLGSNARHEMTLFSDQDNALVFADVSQAEIDSVRRYFLNMSDGVCAKLNKAGYPFCPGGIMAVNPKWCLSLSEWKDKFADWILNSSPESILEINIFADIHCVAGDNSLSDSLQQHIIELSAQNPQFFIHFSRNCLQYKTSLSLLGKIRTETRDGAKTINIKGNLKPLEIIARIYALKNSIKVPGTLDRLQRLIECDEAHTQIYRDMIFVFNYLWQLRFSNQITAYADLKKVNDELDPKSLSEIERLNLKNVLSKIPEFQAQLSVDFLDGTIH
ncbi:MAG: DUF294 nucleotidyltransferase-like domain-containing protein [Candidatus Cloacimonetes bacterium]|nr:DUF294 nucleotidyltransferase-like domain-containing protein [Candidatus Cloacimonadota bacterium]